MHSRESLRQNCKYLKQINFSRIRLIRHMKNNITDLKKQTED